MEPVYVDTSDDDDVRSYVLIDSDDEASYILNSKANAVVIDSDDEGDDTTLITNEVEHLHVDLGPQLLGVSAPPNALATYQQLDGVTVFDTFRLTASQTIQLQPEHGAGSNNGDFLRIHSILKDTKTNNIILRGVRYRRTKRLNGMIEAKTNEVCMLRYAYLDEADNEMDCSLEDVPISDIDPNIRMLIHTNRTDDGMTFRGNLEWIERTRGLRRDNKEDAMILSAITQKMYNTAQLVCRYSHTLVFRTRAALTGGDKQKAKPVEWRFERLDERDSDRNYHISDRVLRLQRKASSSIATVPKETSHQDKGKGRAPQDAEDPVCLRTIIDLCEEGETVSRKTSVNVEEYRRTQHGSYKRCTTEVVEENFIRASKASKNQSRNVKSIFGKDAVAAADGEKFAREVLQDQRYSFADMFSGAGGASEGARQAGLKVAVAVDQENIRCVTFKHNHNHPDTEVYAMEMTEFITTVAPSYRVDILHVSFPCKAFSGLNVVGEAGKDYEKNRDILTALHEMLRALKPRLAVFEETTGLSRTTKHRPWFHTVFMAFTDHNYSLKWKEVKCTAFGVPQSRPRLIIIASALGEKPLRFPKPTHNDTLDNNNPSLLPCPVVADALRNIPPDAANHNPASRTYRRERRKVPYNPHAKIASCVTCSGGEGNYYPDGTRAFTPREFARLSGFPDHYVFFGTDAKAIEQIGDACPPPVFAAIYRVCVKSLRETDLKDEQARRDELTGIVIE